MFRHPKPEALQNAKQLAINLIQTIQSELQTYIQQQPPPVQPQQVIEQSQISQSMYFIAYHFQNYNNCIHRCYIIFFSVYIAQFQTMNIGTLGQPNVVAIQHQGKIYGSYIIDTFMRNIYFMRIIYFFK